ncbi:hypothetical protein SXCC_03175 [Gluconacetobacter sp. SXCC-1]|nr:hypothetical protein SXCC_03175 [Gluconacetobacter sp. SXCC-1]
MHESPPQGGFFVLDPAHLFLSKSNLWLGMATFFILIYNKGILYTCPRHAAEKH